VTYNSALYVRDAIEGVLAQTYPDLQYIICDDCSTDDTWKIIGEYTDPRIRAYRNEANLREYPNRNKAIGLATGEYLIFIDGDDVIFPHALEFFVSSMEAFPDAGMSIQKNYLNNVLYPALLEPDETLRNHFYGEKDLLTSSFASNFFRTALLRKWMLKTGYITGDDEIRLRIAAHYPVLFVAGWVTWPRETPGQASLKVAGGVGLAEAFRQTTGIFGEKDIPALSPELRTDILCMLKKRLALHVLNLWKKGKLKAAAIFLRSAGVQWRDVAKYARHQPVFKDVLTDFTPSAPLKKGFLNK
jgi:hypothetical protein